MDNRTISIAFVRPMLEKSGLSEQLQHQLLSAAGIQLTPPFSDRSRVSPAQFAHLNRLVIEATNDESMGHYPQPLKIGCFDTMARYTQSAEDLQGAIWHNVDFYNLFCCGFELSLTTEGEYCSYRMSPVPGARLSCWVYEQHLMINHRFFCWLTGTPLPLLRVNLNYPAPAHREEYHYLFFSDTRFQQAHSEIIFARRLLNLPIVRSASDLEHYLSRVPYEFLHMPTRESSYTEQIRRYIKKSLPNLPSYEQLAASLGLTPQTLRRRLRQEGCDYRLIKNELIRDMAMDLLLQSDTEVKAIAYQLGFSEPSAFIRAFKQWTGSTPNRYRDGQAMLEE